MKKMILTPKNDSITICLPSEWVGKPMVCILKSPYEMEEDGDMVSQVSDSAMCYSASRFRSPGVHHRSRNRRLRRRSN